MLFCSLILLDISRLRQRQTRIQFPGCFGLTNRQTSLDANEDMTWGGRKEKRRKKFSVNHCWLGISTLVHRTETAFHLGTPESVFKAAGRKPKGDSHIADCDSGF